MTSEVLGRDAELAALSVFLDSLATGPGALVLAGPAGAGKTTLVRAAITDAGTRGFTVLHTMPSRSDVRLAFAGLADLLESRLDAVAAGLPAPQARALRVALLVEEPGRHPPEPRVIAAAFRSALAVLARTAPVLVVVDDAQWLDPPTAAAAGFAARRLEAEQVGLLCAQRTARADEDLPLELGRARLRAEVIPVGGLSPGALLRLLRTRLGVSFPHPTLRRIEAASGGNPFIALEIGRALARRGPGAAVQVTLPVPATLGGLVDEHLGALPAAVTGVLQMVAVMPDAPL